MQLKINIFANYIGAGATILAPLLALPWYLSELGSKQFGLIGFVAMVQTILGLLDSGMSQALVREITVRFESNENGRIRVGSLLLGFERIYWIFAICVGIFVCLLADAIATSWIKLDGLSVAAGREAVYGAAAIFAAQFPGSIYRSLLVGTQAQVALNSVMAVAALARHIGGVLVVVFWPTMSTYLIWHATLALLETFVRGALAWRLLELRRSEVSWNILDLRPIFRPVASMSFATLFGTLAVQIDRIVLSRMIGIEEFGYYTVAAMLAMGSLQIIYPLTQALLPRAIQLRGDPVGLRKLSIKFMGLIAILVGLGAIVFIVFGRFLLDFWLRNPVAVAAIYPVLGILLFGTALNAFYNIGYLNWLAHQRVERVLQVNSFGLVLSVVLIPPLVSWLGTAGAAAGWLSINFFGFVLSLEWLKRKAK